MVDTIIDKVMGLMERDLKVDPTHIDPDTPLFEGGLELDSFAAVELISSIESEFGIQFSDNDFKPENFADLRTVSGVVERYLAN